MAHSHSFTHKKNNAMSCEKKIMKYNSNNATDKRRKLNNINYFNCKNILQKKTEGGNEINDTEKVYHSHTLITLDV